MGTRISFVTECLSPSVYKDKIDQLSADFLAYQEREGDYFTFQRLEFRGLVYFAGATKNLDGYFTEWVEITDVDVSVTWISDEGETGSYMASTWDYKSK